MLNEKSLDDFLVLIGMLSNFGIIIVSAAFINILQGITKINSDILFPYVGALHILFSISFYFALGKLKSFKTGYITGFILSIILFLKMF